MSLIVKGKQSKHGTGERKMAEYEYTEEKMVGINEPITFINNTKSSFTVGVGIMFYEDGAYQVVVNNGKIQVDRIC